MLRYKAAKRNPGDMRTRDIVPDEQFGELVRQVFDRVGAARNGRAPVTRQIIRYQREVFSEPISEIPEVVVDAEAMQQDERPSRAVSFQRYRVSVKPSHAVIRAISPIDSCGRLT
jgi:hypothetical protein